MIRKMIVNAADPEEVRIAILADGRLEDFDIETVGAEKNKGNIYKAVVAAVEPSLNAAFIDYGADKQGFLTAGDVDARLATNGAPKNAGIGDLLKAKQQILVQVTKDEVGAKGAVLTTYLSLAGRYLVLTPDSDHQGVSRRIEDEEERQSAIEIVGKLDVPEGVGVILRTAGRDRPRADLNRDLNFLSRLWDNIQSQAARLKAPALIFKEQDVIIRALRDYYASDVDEIILDADDAFDRASEYMQTVMPRQRSVLTRYVERRPIFHHYRVEEQLDALYTPRVSLPSGGSIVMEQTEALVAIDVNSGKQKLGGHEETALQTNLEAAAEIARQLRLRDLGGIVVVDFIDLLQRKNQAKVEKALREAMRQDKARVKLSRISRNGTLELTRQRIRTALEQSVFRTCTVCHGTGRILEPASHAAAMLRRLLDRASRGDLASATIHAEPEAANLLKTDKWTAIQEIEQRYELTIDIQSDRSLSPGQDDFTFETDPDAVAMEWEEPNFGPAFIPDELRAEIEEDEEEDEEEEVDNGEAAAAGGRKKRRRRRRRRKPERVAGGEKYGLPAFELVDPAELGLSTPEQKAADARKKRRGRRGGRRRKKGQEEMSAAEAVKSAPIPAATEAPKKKRGFFAWLFGKN